MPEQEISWNRLVQQSVARLLLVQRRLFRLHYLHNFQLDRPVEHRRHLCFQAVQHWAPTTNMLEDRVGLVAKTRARWLSGSMDSRSHIACSG